MFIGKIQNVKDFEESINSYREEGDYSIFITGSNSYMLLSELVTKLTGGIYNYAVLNGYSVSIGKLEVGC